MDATATPSFARRILAAGYRTAVRLFNSSLFNRWANMASRWTERQWVKSLEQISIASRASALLKCRGVHRYLHISAGTVEALADRACATRTSGRTQLAGLTRPWRPTALQARPDEALYQQIAGRGEGFGRLPPHPDPERRRRRKLENTAQMEAAQDEVETFQRCLYRARPAASTKLRIGPAASRRYGSQGEAARWTLRRRQLLPAGLPFDTPFMDPVDDSMDNLLPLLNDYQDSWQGTAHQIWPESKRCTLSARQGVAKFSDVKDEKHGASPAAADQLAHRTDEALTLGKARRAAVTVSPVPCAISAATTTALSTSWRCSTARSIAPVVALQSFRIVLAPNKEA